MEQEYSGRMRERLTLQKRVRVEDGLGGDAGVWVDGEVVWAIILGVKTTTAVLGARVGTPIRAVAVVRKVVLTRGVERVMWRGQAFRIASVEIVLGRSELRRLELEADLGVVP